VDSYIQILTKLLDQHCYQTKLFLTHPPKGNNPSNYKAASMLQPTEETLEIPAKKRKIHPNDQTKLFDMKFENIKGLY